jgi:hypothetical protein
MEIFSFYQEMGLHPISSNLLTLLALRPIKQDLREKYGEPNVDEKLFQLF